MEVLSLHKAHKNLPDLIEKVSSGGETRLAAPCGEVLFMGGQAYRGLLTTVAILSGKRFCDGPDLRRDGWCLRVPVERLVPGRLFFLQRYGKTPPRLPGALRSHKPLHSHHRIVWNGREAVLLPACDHEGLRLTVKLLADPKSARVARRAVRSASRESDLVPVGRIGGLADGTVATARMKSRLEKDKNLGRRLSRNIRRRLSEAPPLFGALGGLSALVMRRETLLLRKANGVQLLALISDR